MRYLPCENCQHDPASCRLRLRFAERVRDLNRLGPPGMKLTSAKFTCPDRLKGFEIGARVEVEQAVHNPLTDYMEGNESVHGTVVGYSGLKVQVWTDQETRMGKRWIRLSPRPRQPWELVGVRPTGKQVEPEEAIRSMRREIREYNGGPGDDFFFCPDCESFHGSPADTRGGGAILVCPDCGGRNLGFTEEFRDTIEELESTKREAP